MSKTVDVIVRLKDEVSKKLPTLNDSLYKSFRGVEKFGYKAKIVVKESKPWGEEP